MGNQMVYNMASSTRKNVFEKSEVSNREPKWRWWVPSYVSGRTKETTTNNKHQTTHLYRQKICALIRLKYEKIPSLSHLIYWWSDNSARDRRERRSEHNLYFFWQYLFLLVCFMHHWDQNSKTGPFARSGGRGGATGIKCTVKNQNISACCLPPITWDIVRSPSGKVFTHVAPHIMQITAGSLLFHPFYLSPLPPSLRHPP